MQTDPTNIVRPQKETPVLHPSQFKVNEAWIAFKLNDEAIHTEQDGDFDFLALMDASSCFILTAMPVPAGQAEPTQLESKRLLKEGHDHERGWPKTLFVPLEEPAQFLAAEAERLGIGATRVTQEQLSPFIGEAQEGFREHFGGQMTR
jgi:hypothetical protein